MMTLGPFEGLGATKTHVLSSPYSDNVINLMERSIAVKSNFQIS